MVSLSLLNQIVFASLTISSKAQDVYSLFDTQARATLGQLKGALTYPTNGSPGKYGWNTGSSSGWTSGFFPGTLLKLYNHSGDNFMLDNGRRLTEGLADRRHDTTTHDVGFVMYTSFGQLWHLTNDSQAREYLITTADSLSTRFNPIVGCTRSWNSAPPSFEVIADNLMNLELLWWAGAETGNTSYTTIAKSHADHMIRDLFQPFNPGCAWHLITYDQNTGAVLNRSSTPQGLGLDTVWSRGQAWSVNGFTIAYRYTKDPSYLKQAMSAADCFIRLLTDCCANDVYHYAPFWDFNVTFPDISVDTSAMMIAAEGILELSWYTTGADSARYYAFAKQLLEAAENFWLFNTKDNDAVLKNGTVTYPLAGISITYGDYFYLVTKMKFDSTAPPVAASDAPLVDGGAGFLYAISLNGTTNVPNLLALDLSTYEIRTGPALTSIRETIGQASLLSNKGDSLLVNALIMSPEEHFAIVGLSTATGELIQEYNTSAWPGADGRRMLIVDFLPSLKGAPHALVVGRILGGEQMLYLWDTSSPNLSPAFLGPLNTSGGDLTWDEDGGVLFELLPGANDDESGSLLMYSVASGAPPSPMGTPIALKDHFSFPQFDPLTKTIFGLSLASGGTNGYIRELTDLDPATGKVSTRGTLGEFYVDLENGPKAFDPQNRRSFYMLATSPMGQFDAVAVDVDTGKVLQFLGLCGFIGYCPEGFTYGPG